MMQKLEEGGIGVSGKQQSLQTNYCQSAIVVIYWEVSECWDILIAMPTIHHPKQVEN